MPIERLSKEGAFDPEHIRAMMAAFEGALLALGLINRSDPLVDTVAKMVIEAAKLGERDPGRLRDEVLGWVMQSDRKTC